MKFVARFFIRRYLDGKKIPKRIYDYLECERYNFINSLIDCVIPEQQLNDADVFFGVNIEKGSCL